MLGLVERGERRRRELVRSVLDPPFGGVTRGRERGAVVDPSAPAQTVSRGVPLVVRPLTARALQLARARAGRGRQDVRFAAVDLLADERAHMPVAAVLAQERRRVPQDEVRFRRPCERRVAGEQRTAERAGGLRRPPRQVGGLDHVG